MISFVLFYETHKSMNQKLFICVTALFGPFLIFYKGTFFFEVQPLKSLPAC